MNQPTKDDFDNRLRRVERTTEEIQALRTQDEKKLDATQELANTVKIQMDGARADILRICASQSDFVEKLKENTDILKAVKEDIDGHTEILGKLINSAEKAATKEDIANMATKADISRLETMMQELLRRLPEPGSGA